MPEALIQCAVCGETFGERGHWAAVRAHAAGWFETRDGVWYCWRHIPEWVVEWRKKGQHNKP